MYSSKISIRFTPLFVAFFTMCAAWPSLAQERFRFADGIAPNPNIPSPTQFLGYEPGATYTVHADLLDYYDALAAASDRVTVQEYGRTHEGRKLIYLVITSPENQGRLEEIRTNNLRLSDPRALSDSDADALIQTHPAVQWLSYNIHGNEASSSEAAMQVAYHLAAGTDARTQQILRESVFIMDPCINPDGRDRYVYWFKSAKSHVLNTDAQDYEHDEPWPGGRTNHYWFDLNRDWVWLVHPESQGRIAAYQQWMPQVHVDYHEQGFNSNYFTMPGTSPFNQVLPRAYEDWADYYGRANVREFDRHKINYFTREAFDFFYPGYGSSYPSNMGAIGMLTEQGGHSRGGVAVETNDGYVLTLRQRVFDHYTTSLATLHATVERRTDLLQYFRDFFTPNKTKTDRTAAYIFPDNPNDYTYDALGILMAHGVEVERADADFSTTATDYWTENQGRHDFSAGSFIVRADQPRHVFVRTLLQNRMAIDDSIMYDMSVWSMPLAYNLKAAWTGSAPNVATTRLTAPPMPAGTVTNPNAGYAYVVDWRQRYAPKALAALWKAGYRVRSVQREFTTAGRTYPRGSLVILIGHNLEQESQMVADLQRIARETRVNIEGLNSGRMDTGIDLASRWSSPVQAPHVGLFLDAPMSSYTAGQLWYLLDFRTQLGITRLRLGNLPQTDLSDFDVLILPEVWGNLGSTIDSTQAARLQAWVRNGGTLLATQSAAYFLTKNHSGFTGVTRVTDTERAQKDRPKPNPYLGLEAKADSLGLTRIPGSALRAHLDTTHPLAYGLPNTVYSLKLDTNAFEPDSPSHVVGYYAKDPAQLLASGYVSDTNKTRLAGKAFAAIQQMGAGEIVLLADNTQYRMFWLGPARMILNAVMLLPGM